MPDAVRGRFIVLAGADAVGKTAQADAVLERLLGRGILAGKTAEPTDGFYGRIIREKLAMKPPPGAVEMALLFALDRADHQAELEARLSAGETVITCRYTESSIVYQGILLRREGLGPDSVGWVRAMNRHFLRPDLYVVLDVGDMERGRRLTDAGKTDAYEVDRGLQAEVAATYRRLGEFVEPVPVRVVDGAGPREAVTDRVFAAVQSIFGSLA